MFTAAMFKQIYSQAHSFNSGLRVQVLTYGLATAAILRLIMILAGAELIDRFQPVLLGFAVLLLFSAWKLLTRRTDDEEEDLSNNNIVRLCRYAHSCSQHPLVSLLLSEPIMHRNGARFCRIKSWLLFCARRFITVTDSYDGDRFFTKRGNERLATPLLLALAVVEISDVVFAVDSIPAVPGLPTSRLCPTLPHFHHLKPACKSTTLLQTCLSP